MIALCKRTIPPFKKGEYYTIQDIHSVFETNDFITIVSKNEDLSLAWYRFRLNKSLDYIDNYIGTEEDYFYDYFVNITEDRRNKLEHLSGLK